MHVEPYLYFGGDCEEALQMYAAVFGGTVSHINRYAGSPIEAQAPPGFADKVMHASFEAPGIRLMAADSPAMVASRGADTGRVWLSLAPADEVEARRIFDALGDGGRIDFPLQKTFWGALLGTVTDRFGIGWMVSV